MGCGCECGCSQNVSYGHIKSCKGSYAGIYFCKDPLSYIKKNFIIPEDGEILEITVTDSSRLYVGMGFALGDNYFHITAIEDSTHISIVQNGTAEVGLQITAINGMYGCFQYPMIPIGPIDQLIDPEVQGLDGEFAPVGSSIVDPVGQLTYSYLSPVKVQFEFQLECTIANAPRYVEVELPVEVSSGSPEATFSVIIDNGSGFVPAIAYRNTTTTLVIALDAATDLANEDSLFRVSGTYDLR